MSVLFESYGYVHLSQMLCPTHWGREKMDTILQTTSSSAFSWMKMFEFQFKISLMFIPKGPINNIPALA